STLFFRSRLPPTSTPFPYTTLFRSRVSHGCLLQNPDATRRCADAFKIRRTTTLISVRLRGHHLSGWSHAAAYGELERRWLLLERDRKSTRLNSSHVAISYAVFCLKK